MPIADSNSAVPANSASSTIENRRSASADATTSSIVLTANTGSFGSTAFTSRRIDSASAAGSAVVRTATDKLRFEACQTDRYTIAGAAASTLLVRTSRTTPTIVSQLIVGACCGQDGATTRVPGAMRLPSARSPGK